MNIVLRPVTEKDIEWLRVNRNDPKQYKYFRQDKPITPEEQKRWWRTLNKTRVRLFIVEDHDLPEEQRAVGYVGLNPLNLYASSAEFGIFITIPNMGKGYGKAAMLALLKHGFRDLHLSSIYSDCLQYPGENRFGFYKKLGFLPFAEACQMIRYRKQGKYIPSLKFYMTRDRYEELHGKDRPTGLASAIGKAAGVLQKVAGQGQSIRPG